ncbi:MAG: PIN domain-containing protein [Candidatus Sumerlaeota bacterium]|nr:PIN domain-containing protein [Candidatus Sumerlaeota bacterium]
MPIVAVVADANVLLSCVVGKAALRVMTDYGLAVHVARFNAGEVREYLPRMAAKYQLSPHLVELQWRLLPVTVHEPAGYAQHVPRALADLKDRDPEDAHALALARALALPLWSNDRHFDGVEIRRYSTARLLSQLAREQSPP